jgi:hypothetical protein
MFERVTPHSFPASSVSAFLRWAVPIGQRCKHLARGNGHYPQGILTLCRAWVGHELDSGQAWVGLGLRLSGFPGFTKLKIRPISGPKLELVEPEQKENMPVVPWPNIWAIGLRLRPEHF